MDQDRISLRQLLTLTFAALLSPAIRILPGRTAEIAGEGGWLAAVAALPVLCELCLPLVRAGGQFLAMKSSHTGEEIASAEKAIALLGGRIGAVRDYTIPGSDVVHRVVVIDKVSPTPKKYPRRFAQIKKQPIGCPPADKETPGGKT